MIETVICLALIITAIHVCFWQGNILGFARIWTANQLDKYLGIKWSRYVQKPLWDCLPCMSSVWTIVIAWEVDVLMILAVCGAMIFIDQIIVHPDSPDYVKPIKENEEVPAGNL
jgi:G:T-mismatch repair DNA endonuclease (very short patch repair protein)